MNDSVAPSCPISHSQDPHTPRGTAPTRLPAIPIATDLPSLIRSVNIMRDILRNITTSLTVNNTYLPKSPRPPKIYGDRNYTVSPYPDWTQESVVNKSGFVGKDPKARAYVERLDTVVFRNNSRDEDNLFKWNYRIPLTGEGGGSDPFEEDFFERIVKVKWKKKGDPKYYSATWFWNVHCTGSGGAVSQGCTPWTPVPGNAGSSLFPMDEHVKWQDPKITLFGVRPTTWILIGDPTGSGGGSSSGHAIGGMDVHGDIFNPDVVTVIGESFTGTITGQTLSEAKCWGSFPYPPSGLGSFWSALCRVTLGTERSPCGAVTVNAAGISATDLDGNPLTKVKTEITASNRAQGGTITVTFSDEDPD